LACSTALALLGHLLGLLGVVGLAKVAALELVQVNLGSIVKLEHGLWLTLVVGLFVVRILRRLLVRLFLGLLVGFRLLVRGALFLGLLGRGFRSSLFVWNLRAASAASVVAASSVFTVPSDCVTSSDAVVPFGAGSSEGVVPSNSGDGAVHVESRLPGCSIQRP
jgi:hypothetical protein